MTLKMLAIGILALLGLSSVMNPKAFRVFLGGFGALCLALGTVAHLITLPVEIDASFNRALPMLENGKILKDVDKRHSRKILKAAAFTYVSASLMSLLNIARWFAILRR